MTFFPNEEIQKFFPGFAHTTWGADQQTLLHLYRALIRSKLDYGCIVYGSARSSYLWMLDPVQNHSLRLCLGAFRTSPSSSLCILANEPPLHLRRQKLSMQYCLRLSSTSQNPAYSAIFNSKFISSFDRKPNQIPPLGIRIQSHLQAIGFRRKDTLQCPTLPTPPWLLHRPEINYSLHSLHKDDTAPEIFRHNFNELCADYKHCTRFTPMDPKWVMEWPRQLFGKNRANLFGYQAMQASSEQNCMQSAWHLTLSVVAEIRTSSSSLTRCLACKLWADLNWK